MVKTKIIKRRVEIKIAKKQHNLIRCKCRKCGEKKWSQYNKRSSKVLCLAIINLVVWGVAIDGFSNWYGQRGSWVFENASAAVFEETSLIETAQSVSGGLEVSGMAANTTASVAVPTGGTQVSSVSGSVIEAKILEVFNGDKVAVAVAKSESGLDPNAKGYNCRYGNRSTSCKPEDRHKAWSVDCGVYQINTIAKDCPEHLMDPETNIAVAKEMQSKRGWNPWVAYWNGQYKNHMN